MATKTEEDWFLRGGERPSEDAGEECRDFGDANPAMRAIMKALEAGDEGVLQDWIVTMSRTKSVQQTAHVRVKAHSEEEALDLIEDRAEDEAGSWTWDDVDCTEEYDDVEAVEAGVVI